MLQVRMQVDLSPVSASETPSACLHAITFTLISGNIRRFRRICEHIQSMVSIYKNCSPAKRKTSEYMRVAPDMPKDTSFAQPIRGHWTFLNLALLTLSLATDHQSGLCVPPLRTPRLPASPAPSPERLRDERELLLWLRHQRAARWPPRSEPAPGAFCRFLSFDGTVTFWMQVTVISRRQSNCVGKKRILGKSSSQQLTRPLNFRVCYILIISKVVLNKFINLI